MASRIVAAAAAAGAAVGTAAALASSPLRHALATRRDVLRMARAVGKAMGDNGRAEWMNVGVTDDGGFARYSVSRGGEAVVTFRADPVPDDVSKLDGAP